MAGPNPFSYAIFRLVPRVERGEQVNVGVLAFCPPLGYLAVRTALDERRVMALWPEVDLPAVRAHLRALERIAAGEPDAGPVAALDVTQRFHWLVSPSSTVVQPSPVHTGLTDDPEGTLDRLFDRLVA